MYEIIICPVKQLYQRAEDGDMSDVAVLAVSSYEINTDKLNIFADALCLNFADTANPTGESAFNKTTAKNIADYVKSLPVGLDSLFVCCDAGESRSTAMAAAIMRFNGLDEMKIWKNPHYHPNLLVYSLLCEALGVAASESELIAKKQASEKAFIDAFSGK